MPSRKVLDLIEQYMIANAAHQWDKAQKIYEELKAQERRDEEKEKRDKEDA